MVLLLIVLLWAVFLGPGLVRRLLERRSGDSIGSFHRQLGVLRRTGPTLVPPANKLTTAEAPGPSIGATGLPIVSSRPSLVVLRHDPAGSEASASGSAAPGAEEVVAPGSARHLAAVGEPATVQDAVAADYGAVVAQRGIGRHNDPYFRPAACKRRRDVLSVMAALFVGTGLVGAIPAARPALVVTALAALALGAYIMLLVHLRNVVAERETKVRYLPAPVVAEPQVVVRRSAVR